MLNGFQKLFHLLMDSPADRQTDRQTDTAFPGQPHQACTVHHKGKSSPKL